jgi:hypothetical protein
VAGETGDGGPATSAKLRNPLGIRIDSSGSIYFSDGSACPIRSITPGGIINTLAGDGSSGNTGDGLATSAKIPLVWDIAFGSPTLPFSGVLAETQIDAHPPGVDHQFVRFRLRGFAGFLPRCTATTVTVTANLDSASISQNLVPNMAIARRGLSIRSKCGH